MEALAIEVARDSGVRLSSARERVKVPIGLGTGTGWDILWFIVPFVVLAGLAIYGAFQHPAPLGRRNWDGTYGSGSGAGGYSGGSGFSGGGGFGGFSGGCSGGGGSSGGW